MFQKTEFTRRVFPILILLILLVTQAGVTQANDPAISQLAAETIPLPEQADWQDMGIAIQEGADGEWDRYLWGGFANSLIKKAGTYYLYYQGSAYYDNTCESVAYRSIGVATSNDGIHWTKYPGNPVITWASRGSIEEGAASSGAWLGDDGKIYIYYGANTGTGCTVNADGRLAVSTDGLNFSDQGRVISWQNSAIWGYGDEIFPIGAYEHQGAWNVFYTPNGSAQARRLGVVSGGSPTSLTSSAGVNGGNLPAWGTASTVLNGNASILFVNDGGTDQPLKAYRFDAANPRNMTLAKTYLFPDCARFSVLNDADQSRWLLLCSDKPDYAAYRIKVANQQTAPTATPPASTATPAPTPTPGPTATPTSIAPSPTPTAAASTGTLVGTVTSSQGGAVPEVEVTANDQSLHVSVYTDSAGRYVIADLPPGTYDVRYAKVGFMHETAEVTIRAGSQTVQDVTMIEK